MHEAAKLGMPVFLPVTEGGRYDLILDIRGRLVRVQCKSARRVGEIIDVKARTCRRIAGGKQRVGTYSASEIDFVGVFCPEIECCYLVPIADVPPSGSLYLRLAPSKNGQELGIKWAKQYELGAIAQLGERSAGSRKVVGSSPTSSTVKSRPPGRLF
ncbi:MAG: hypothetical protein QOE08_415 [Thermoleophilaceae bacterium]|nr:hypothetical protein [Thermoleophilaceae bacterium]